MANNDLLNDSDISLIANMQNVDFLKKKDRKVTIIIAIISAIAIATIVMLLIFNNEKYRIGNLGKIMDGIDEIKNAQSYEVNSLTTYLENDNVGIYSIENKLVKKEDNLKLTASINDIDESINLGGLFINGDRMELLFQDNESVYARYKDIFSVIKTYLPKLSELTNDLAKINYQKYIVLFKKELSNFQKSYNFDSYYKFVGSELENKVQQRDIKVVVDGKEKNYKEYIIDEPARDIIEIKVKLLNKIKNDKDLRKLINRINTSLLDYIGRSRDYENVRMTLDEYKVFKMKYSEEMITLYDEKLDEIIKKYEVLYSKVSPSKNEKYIFTMNEKGEIIKLETNTANLLNNKVVFVDDVITISNYNKVRSKDVVPSCDTRINLASLDRSKLFETFEIVKNKYKNLLDQLAKNIISNIK